MAPSTAKPFAHLPLLSRSCVSRRFSSTACTTSWASYSMPAVSSVLRGRRRSTTSLQSRVWWHSLWGAHEDFAISDFTSPQFWLLSITTTLGVVCPGLWCSSFPCGAQGVLQARFSNGTRLFGFLLQKVAGWTFTNLKVCLRLAFFRRTRSLIADNYTDQNPISAGLAGYSAAFLIFMLPQSVITVCLYNRDLYAGELRGRRRQ